MDVSRETIDRLKTYHDLLLRWQKKINLIAPSTVDDAWQRHFEDSIQIMDLEPDNCEEWIDIGSGAGFPGMVVAILGAELLPGMKVSLVESDQRKCAFLRTVSRETNVPVTIHAKRIDALPPMQADILSARALASLDKLLPMAHPILKPDGKALLHKGANWRQEVEIAQEAWRFKVESHRSKTNPDAVLLEVSEIERA